MACSDNYYRRLVEEMYGYSVDYKSILESIVEEKRPFTMNSYGETPLTMLAEEGEVSDVILLLNNGFDINERDRNGWTALFAAASHGRISTVKELVKRGADINLKNNEGVNAVVAAAIWLDGTLEVVKFLLENGADILIEDDEGNYCIDVEAEKYQPISPELLHILTTLGYK
jgi:ankyrin repeat protein